MACRAGTTTLFLLGPTLAPIYSLKFQHRLLRLAESIPVQLKSLQIPSLDSAMAMIPRRNRFPLYTIFKLIHLEKKERAHVLDKKSIPALKKWRFQ